MEYLLTFTLRNFLKNMTLLHHVYAVKEILAHGMPASSFSFSNRLIAHFLQVSRARLVEQKVDKYHYVSEQTYQSLCMELELSNFHNCCTVPDLNTCKVLKSKTTVPKFLNSRWGNHLKVMDLEGMVISELSMTQNRHAKYALIPPGIGYFIHSNYLYIINNKVITNVLLNALYDDPEQIKSINCPIADDEDCPSFMSEDFPMDADLVDPMYRMTIDLITKSYQFTNDRENNSRDVEQARGLQ